MSTEHLRARIHKGADRIERGVGAAAEKLANGAEALDRRQEEVRTSLGDVAQRLRDGTRGLSDKVESQVRMHPLATFGVAFAAGLIVARVLRR